MHIGPALPAAILHRLLRRPRSSRCRALCRRQPQRPLPAVVDRSRLTPGVALCSCKPHATRGAAQAGVGPRPGAQRSQPPGGSWTISRTDPTAGRAPTAVEPLQTWSIHLRRRA